MEIGDSAALYKCGVETVADHLPPVSTRSAVTRVQQRLRPCC